MSNETKVETSVAEAALTPEEKAKAVAFAKAIEEERKALQTDTSTRPAFDGAAAAATDSPVLKKGYLPPMNERDREAAVKGINVNLFPQGDIDNFSVARLALAQAKAASMGEVAWKQFAPWEKAYIDGMVKANLGDAVSGQDGGYLAPEIWSTTFYDRLYANALVGQLPVTHVRVSGRVQHFPVLVNGVVVYWSAENTAITASSPQFRQMTLTPRKQSALTYISNEMILDANEDAENILRNNIAREMAQDLDKQVFIGAGTSGTPIGLLNQTNVGSGAMLGASLTYSDLSNSILKVMQLNNSANVGVGNATCTGIAANTALLKQVANFKDTNNRPLWDFGLRGMPLPGKDNALGNFLGVPNVATSNVLTATEGSQQIFFGDWQFLVIGERTDVEFMASTVAGTAFASDQTAVRAIRRVDVALAHPEAFFVLTPVSS